jgi:hypothetical protein
VIKITTFEKNDFGSVSDTSSYRIHTHVYHELEHPRTQGKTLVIDWSRDSTKINCPRGSGKVSNYMLPHKTLNFIYQEWDFTIHSSKRPLTSILYLCLLLNYKNTVAFYQQSSQETNKTYTSNFEVGYSGSQTYFHIKLVSRQSFFTFICF